MVKATFKKLLTAATGTLRARCITSAVIFTVGDTIAQQGVEKKGWERHDLYRTACMTTYGGMIYAPIMSSWFKVVGRINHPNKVVQTVTRVVVDQGVGGPSVPVLFFTCMTLMEGGSFQDVRRKLEAAWFNTWKTGVTIWVPASTINMTVVPPDARVLFTNSVALMWNVYLSYTNERHRILLGQRTADIAHSASKPDVSKSEQPLM